jgi:hypothetical protein
MISSKLDVVGLPTSLTAEREYLKDGKVTKMIVLELTDHTLVFSICIFNLFVLIFVSFYFYLLICDLFG